jgi:parallel beta-helix repeat protein
MYRPLALLVLLAGCQSPVEQETRRVVAPAADGEWDDTDVADNLRYVYGTIQEAIDAASPGDVVEVQSGTFTENLTLRDGVRVVGAGKGETVLEGTVRLTGLAAPVGLSRMSVVNAGAPYTDSGILVEGGTATLSELAVSGFDIGIQLFDADDVLVDANELTFNDYGIWSDESRGNQIQNNMLRSNWISGITNYTSTGSVVFNTLVGNAFAASAEWDFGGALQFGELTELEDVANNIVVSNFYGVNCQECSNHFSNNLVWGNSTNYTGDASQMGDDMNVDPQFANPSEFDYALTIFSPAIDEANSAYRIDSDADGEARPAGGGYDVGRDEFSISSYDLLITEVMANATVETVLEFVELYNDGGSPLELTGLHLTDGDDDDILTAFDGGPTVLSPGEFAVVVDPDYDGSYGIDPSVVLVTTGDTNIGNGLTTSDTVELIEPDGSTTIATFSYPKDPGDGVSMEMFSLALGDVSGNWRESACDDGSSPGAVPCFPPSGDPAGLVLTEVLANGWSEANDEYVEIYNPTDTVIDAAGLVITDGDSSDVLKGFANSSTLIGAFSHALIVDPGYSYSYFLPNGVTLLTTGDASIGNGLATTDPVTLMLTDGVTPIDSFGFPENPGDGYSIEKLDYAGGDVEANWEAATGYCTRGRSPARLNGAAGGLCDQLLINEVMSNPMLEDSGEYVELFNAGFEPVDLAGLLISDPTHTDVIAAYDGRSTVLEPLAFALVIDVEYADDYELPADVVLVTTEDTHIGNGLKVDDEVRLWEGDFLVDAYEYAFNAGNGISVERIWDRATDAAQNWVAATCPTASSPGLPNCATGGVFGGSGTSDITLVITEILANALDEDTGEFVEVYNYGPDPVDLGLFVLWDGDAVDTLFGYWYLGDTILEPGGYAVILDNEYAMDHDIALDALWLTTGDTTLGSGLSTEDEVFLFEPDGLTLIDSYTSPSNPGDGVSREKVDPLGGDILSNWADSICDAGSSPGDGECAEDR